MCFNTWIGGENPPKPLIAKKNIICYKFLEKKSYGLVGPYNGLKIEKKLEGYEEGFIYGDSFSFTKNIFNEWDINKGFHSFRTIVNARGYQASWYCFKGLSLYRFMIPKGAEYYQNATQYCSNQIQLLSKVKEY